MGGNMADRRAIVTGAGSGIGRAIADRLVGQGYKVMGADVTWRGDYDETRGFSRWTCDVRKSEDVRKLFSECMSRGGSLDVVVNSAGVSGRWQIATITDEEWNRVVDINLFGTFACMREAAGIMSAQKSGRIINIASNRGLHGLKWGSPYAASKGGVIALTKTGALELGVHNVGVFALLPGATDTPLMRGTRTEAQVAEMKGLNPPEYVADAVLPLLAPEAITYSGACISLARRESSARE
jgi:NAD(P)-dependent dehydrogenase (short-subunit alcohol dehydrogenase family)